MPTIVRNLAALPLILCCGGDTSPRGQGGEAPQNIPILDEYSVQVTGLLGRTFFTHPGLGFPGSLAVAGRALVVADELGDTPLFVVDRATRAIISRLGRRGDGPGEFRTVWSLTTSRDRPSEVWAFDAGLLRLTPIRLSDAGGDTASVQAERSFQLTPKVQVLQVASLGSGRFIAHALLPDGQFLVFDTTGRVLEKLGPPPPEIEGVPAVVRAQAYRGAFTLKPDASRMALALRHGGQATIFDSSGQPVQVVQTPFRFSPKFGVKDTRAGPWLTLGADTRMGYLAIASSTNFLFALFSGRTIAGFPRREYYGDYVHVFTWDGKLHAVLKLQAEAVDIAVDETGTVLYASATDPEPSVYEYFLDAALRKN
ncbi:MAG: hypothetical protein KatS3mg081_2142 [Gemmatimonadales bacterium]|nr:MAG: hypothetical protein KatS3mg081_2142 [Gemmatimonadales bacterium]